MKPPKRIRVGPRTYDVVVDSTAISLASAEAEQVLEGSCDNRKQVITIRKGLHPDAEATTVLHEALHAIVETQGLGRLFPDDGVEESLVRALESPLLALLRDNPRLVSYLVGD